MFYMFDFLATLLYEVACSSVEISDDQKQQQPQPDKKQLWRALDTTYAVTFKRNRCLGKILPLMFQSLVWCILNIVYFFNFLCGGVLPIITLMLRWLDSDGSAEVGKGLSWFLRIIPIYAFGEGMINLGSV